LSYPNSPGSGGLGSSARTRQPVRLATHAVGARRALSVRASPPPVGRSCCECYGCGGCGREAGAGSGGSASLSSWIWKGGRAVECTGLENRQAGNPRLGSSNLPPSVFASAATRVNYRRPRRPTHPGGASAKDEPHDLIGSGAALKRTLASTRLSSTSKLSPTLMVTPGVYTWLRFCAKNTPVLVSS
jgi:hypothetical protein